jgi:PKD repeat protein/uncharacterized protein YjdB
MEDLFITKPDFKTRFSMRKYPLSFIFRLFLSTIIFSLVATNSGAQVTANFVADDTADCAPMLVHFTSTSTGATSYTWNLGNGTPPIVTTSPTVSGSYTSAGTYTVTLTATNGTSSSSYSSVVKAYAAPSVNFTASDTAFCPGGSPVFTSTTAANAWGGLTYNWVFGDGTSSALSAPTHTYGTSGYYTVTLFATNSKGCEGSLVRSNYIHVYTPATVSFGSTHTFSCKPPAAVPFTNSTTGTSPLTYLWSFGDGTSSAGTAPTHTYTLSGAYSVKLKVTDGKGCVDSTFYPGYITVGAIHAAFTPVANVCPSVAVTFLNTSTTFVSDTWYFGDGATSTDYNGVHAYAAGGTYTVKLVIFDGICYDTVTHPITVYPAATGTFTLSPAAPCPPPGTVTFHSAVGAGSSVFWIFGDADTVSGAAPSHFFSNPWIYTNRMVVTSINGCIDTVTQRDTMNSLVPSVFAIPSASGCAPLSSTFSVFVNSDVYDPVAGVWTAFPYPYSVSSYSWNFGDGSALSTAPSPSHTYTTSGAYNMVLTIHTSNGCSTSVNDSIKVGFPQHPSFVASSTHICADRTVNFRSTSTDSTLIDYYTWDFGDSYTDACASCSYVTHHYLTPGIDSVSLNVLYRGCGAVVPYKVGIVIDSPEAIMNFRYACTPLDRVTFIDTSLGDASHQWIFSDGTVSGAHSITHDFASLTTYTVSLATYNATTGCRDTVTSKVYLQRPYLNFDAYHNQVCRDQVDTIISAYTEPDTVSFHDPVFHDTAGARKYTWYMDGSAIDSSGPNLVRSYHSVGYHSFNLIVVDNHGCLDTVSKTNFLLVAKPIDSFSYIPLSGCASLPVHFTDRSSDVTGASLYSYYWTFGDGTPGATSIATPVHTYVAAGSYTVQEIVTDNIGCTDTFQNRTTINVYKPNASFTTSATTVCGGTNVYFNNTSSGISSSLWIFGDGTTSTTTSPYHVFSVSGTYPVKLVVYDSHSCASDTAYMLTPLTVNPYPHVSFYMPDSFAVCSPFDVTFINTTTGATYYDWLFGDGTTSTATSPGDVYTAPGYYTVMLIGGNAYGCIDTAVGHVNLFGYAGAFSYTPLSGCAPLSVHFTAHVSSVTSVFWDFLDGTVVGTGTTDTVSHIYTIPGAYIPKLILTDSFGCTNFSLGVDTIKVDSVMAAFSVTPDPVCQNSSVSFTDASVSALSSVSSWTWSIASGVSSTISSPAFTYTTSGTHAVSLTVTDRMGCTGTAVSNVTVNPLPGAISGPSAVCQYGTGTYTDTSSSGVWSSSNTTVATIGSTSGVLSGLARGTTTIFYTMPSGCYVSRVITVNAAPATITGTPGMCAGAYTSLADGTSGGTWTVSPTTVGTISSSGSVYGVAAGTATVAYTVAGCSATLVVTVSTAPAPISGTSFSVCAMYSDTLTDLVSGGTWISSTPSLATVGSASGIVTGVASGTDVITYSLGTGCYTTKAVTVNALFPISGSTGLCIGATTTLTDMTGGRWTSSNLSVATIGSTTGSVTGVAVGTTNITFTVVATGCRAVTVLTVNASPSAIAGDTHVCAGSTIPLIDTVSGGLWTESPSATANIGSLSGIVTGINAGVANITYSLGTGCTRYYSVTVNPVPNPISGDAPVCKGGTVTLHDVTAGGVWSSATPSFGSITSSGVVTGLAAGSATISYTLSAGCAAVAIVTINPLPAMITGPTQVCVGGSITLSDSSSGGTWSFGGGSAGVSIGSISGTIGATSAGSATFVYTLPTGCTRSYTITVNPLPVAITGRSHLCLDSYDTLSDPSSGGTWSSGSLSVASIGSVSGIINGLTVGYADITYTLSTGCMISEEVTVNPLPGSITGSSNVCIGLATTFLDGTSGGVWSSSNPAVGSVGASTGTVGGISTGVAVISYTIPITGCSALFTVSVNHTASPVTGIPRVCVGTSSTLYDVTAGGTWSSSDAGIVSVNTTGVISGVTNGVATVTYSLGGTCVYLQAVTVNSYPVPVSGGRPVCVGAFDSLTDSPTGGVWSTGNPFVAVIDTASGILEGAGAGIVGVTYTIAPGCYSTGIVTVQPLPAPISGPTEICYGYTGTLRDVSSGGVWSSADPTIGVVSSSGVVSGVGGGDALISYTEPSTGCASTYLLPVVRVPAIQGTHALCAYGDTLTVYDSLAGGIWSSRLVTVSPSGAVLAFGAGTATITYTMPGGCYNFTTFTVNPLPAYITGSYRACAGLTTALTDTSSGGVWSVSPSTTASISSAGVVTGTAAGVAVVTYAFPATGCIATQAVTICPFPSAIIGGSAVCVGDTLDLSDTVSGGTWSSSSLVVASIGVHSGILSGLYNGTASITYSAAPACSVSRIITVDALPVAFVVTGGGSYCSFDTGLHVGLSGSATGVSYQLYRGTTVVGASVSGTGHSLDFGLESTAGVYKVVGTNTVAGCLSAMSDSATISIVAAVTPSVNISASPSATLCAGDTVTFHSITLNGGSTPGYEWTVNGSVVSGTPGSSYAYVPANGDVVSVILVSDARCARPDTVAGNSVTMTVDPELMPVVTITAVPGLTISSGNADTLTATATGAGTSPAYQWYVNGVPVSGATNAVYIADNYNNGDSVTCIVTSNGTCGGHTGNNSVKITVHDHSGVGVVNSVGGDVVVIPNPNKGEFVVKCSSGLTDGSATIEVTDMLGQVVYSEHVQVSNGAVNKKVQLGHVANGVYLLMFRTDAGSAVFHVVVEQ